MVSLYLILRLTPVSMLSEADETKVGHRGDQALHLVSGA